LKQELEETAKKLNQTEAENKALQSEVAALKAKSDNPDLSTASGTQPATSPDVAGRERKRKRRDDDETQNDTIGMMLNHLQRNLWDEWTEQLELMRTVFGRIVPFVSAECHEGWKNGKMYQCFFKLVSTRNNLRKLQQFMDERPDNELYCLKCLMQGKDYPMVNLDAGHDGRHECWDTIHLVRVKGAQNRYYYARYIR
jgi:hypothetical protein